MAKFRFPGKALKLTNRKRVKFYCDNEKSIEEIRALQIKAGILLFRSIFGDSDEEDEEFDGFTTEVSHIKLQNETAEPNESNKDISKSTEYKDKKNTSIEFQILPKVSHQIANVTNLNEDLKSSNELKLGDRLAKKRDKLLRKEKGKLPDNKLTVVKPNAKITSDVNLSNSSSNSPKNSACLVNSLDSSYTDDEGASIDPVTRSITLYTEAITEQVKGPVGRPKKLARRTEVQENFEYYANRNDSSPVKDPKENKVKEKIEKLLRSPWDKRLKQNTKPPDKIKEASKTILRKARLNLSKKTLQKIRRPSSIKKLVPTSENDCGSRKCGLCQVTSFNTVCCYGVSCCETCHLSINCFVEGTYSSLVCQGCQGECQLVGLSLQERCEACWLSKILLTCAMPNLLHNRLREQLPNMIKERVPTSFGRSYNMNLHSLSDRDGHPISGDDVLSGAFGSIVDLPGGWKRKNGSEVTVISPAGEKFRSIPKLEEYLMRMGINAEAGVLFGSSIPKNNLEPKTLNAKLQKINKINNVVVTTLPGGWTRRIKWKMNGDKFDTYVCSPDGRTFRSSKELSAYFQRIGKIDDINKYFPVKSSPPHINSSENSEASTMEPFSSSEAASERTTDGSDSEKDALEIEEELIDYKSDLDDNSINIKELYNNDSSAVIISDFGEDFNQSLNQLNDCVENENLKSSKEIKSSAINLNLFVDHKSDEEYVDHKSDGDEYADHKSDEDEYADQKSDDNKEERIVLKIPKEKVDLKEHKHRHKKHKKKKKKKHSKKDDEESAVQDKSIELNISTSSLLCESPTDEHSLFHPNDTWQSLINHQDFEGFSKVPNRIPENVETQDLFINNVETEEPLIGVDPKHAVQKASEEPEIDSKKLSRFTKEKFGSGWMRKIKWDREGCGKVAFLTSPSGQRIVSSIELLGYFKKEGKPMVDIDFYFPKDLVRDVSQCELEDETLPIPKYFSKLKGRKKLKHGRGRGRKILFSLPKKKLAKISIEANSVQNNIENFSSNTTSVDLNQDTSAVSKNTDGGPRVKNVCRSQAQVLGMPRAVFPSPDGNEKEIKKVIHIQKTKYMPVLTPTGRKILKKTIWCHKCTGCTTPNCRKCTNCLDMKKYGGPGTKKKPCIMRKCINPIKAVKVPDGKERTITVVEKAKREKTIPSSKKGGGGDSDILSIKLSSLQSSESDMFDEVDSYINKDSDDLHHSSEQSVSIPKLVNRSVNEVKERGDSNSGIEYIPSDRVNINYWQEYDAEEMLLSGFPIITSIPFELGSLCFRCGSAGTEELLYCIWCCEGVHPFCLEEGEGPESDEEEVLWVCKRCTVCHVCGGAGTNDLMQCNDCKMHFHVECLGPSSHVTCHTTSDGAWMSSLLNLFSNTWVQQNPLIDMSEEDITLESEDLSPSLYDELESLQHDENGKQPLIYLLPTAQNFNSDEALHLPDKLRKRGIYIESVLIEDTKGNLLEEGGFCLEDAFDCFDDEVKELSFKEDTIQLYTDVNLNDELDDKFKDLSGINDEYLSLGYSKINPYHQEPVANSVYELLEILRDELFTVLNYVTWSEMYTKGLVQYKEMKSELDEEKLDIIDNDIDWKALLEIRRMEIQMDIKKKIQEERRRREIEKERIRELRRMVKKAEENNDQEEEETTSNTKEESAVNEDESLSKDNSQQSSTEPSNESMKEDFIMYDNAFAGNKSWQPKTWEEFDELMSRSTFCESGTDSHDGNVKKSLKLIQFKNGKYKKIKKLNKIIDKRKRLLMSPAHRNKLKISHCSIKVPKLDIKNMKKTFKNKSVPKLYNNKEKSPKSKLLQSLNSFSSEVSFKTLNTTDTTESLMNINELITSATSVNGEIKNDDSLVNEHLSVNVDEFDNPNYSDSEHSQSPCDKMTIINDCKYSSDSKNDQVKRTSPDDLSEHNHETKRSRRSGNVRASELASLRKARLDM